MDQKSYVETKIQLPNGPITGLVGDGIFQARGITYAKARRFQPPTPLETWDSPIRGTEPACVCPQNPSRLSSVTGDIIQGRPMSEDCLHLTITAPAHVVNQKAKLPTLVFLHGGANVSGGGDLPCYDPRSLASRGMVVVNVTYRLGIFGWIPIEGVAPPNLGLMDQIEALRWVQKNIASVGGDPQQVTVAGHSVGAHAIFCMMMSDDASGLFQRAILQSTPFGWQTVSSAASDEFARVAKSHLPNNPELLSTEELLAAQTKLIPEGRRLGLHLTVAWPHFGKYPLPDISEIQKRTQEAATKYRVLIGWTQNESSAFAPMRPNYDFYSSLPLVGQLYSYAAIWWYTREEFIWPSQQFCKTFGEAGGSASVYRVQWSPPNSRYGAVHCMELAFLLGSWEAWKTAPMVHGVGAEEVLNRVGPEVKDAWAAFVCAAKFPSTDLIIDDHFQFKRLSPE